MLSLSLKGTAEPTACFCIWGQGRGGPTGLLFSLPCKLHIPSCVWRQRQKGAAEETNLATQIYPQLPVPAASASSKAELPVPQAESVLAADDETLPPPAWWVRLRAVEPEAVWAAWPRPRACRRMVGLWFWGTVPGRQAGLQLKPSSRSAIDSFKRSISVTAHGCCSNCSQFHGSISNQLLITGLQFGEGTVRKRGQSYFPNFVQQL